MRLRPSYKRYNVYIDYRAENIYFSVKYMNRFAPLFSQIVDSSLWEEKLSVRIVFLTMLAKKDCDHVVRGTLYNLHRWANVSQEEVMEAIKVLESPDERRRLEKQEFEGRRIEKVEGGWKILNGAKYEREMQRIAEQVRKAKWAREHRAMKAGTPLPGERAYERELEKNGQEAADRLMP